MPAATIPDAADVDIADERHDAIAAVSQHKRLRTMLRRICRSTFFA